MRLRKLLPIAVFATAAPAMAQDIAIKPLFGTQLRYAQSTTDSLLSTQDSVLLRALPGLDLSAGPWSIEAISDASVAVRRTATPNVPVSRSPQAIGLSELRLNYGGLPATEISVGRQRLGLAGASITGDRDGDQTFDAARLKWSGIAGLSADIAYAWASTTSWAVANAPLPENVAGQNLFAQIDWQNPIGTLSGYAYQVDQRHASDSDFRLLNQVYGARLTGKHQLTPDVRLNYSLGLMRQSGSLTTPVTIAPTYWQVASTVDLGELSGSSLAYRKFAATGISTMNGDTLSLATSATKGRMTVGATFNEFKPLPDTIAIASRDVRVSVGMVF